MAKGLAAGQGFNHENSHMGARAVRYLDHPAFDCDF
jgi:hypothetical protein